MTPRARLRPAAASACRNHRLSATRPFERVIYLKQNAAWLLEQELRRSTRGEEIAIGTATDPYQPIERRARITRSLLEVFARAVGYHRDRYQVAADRARRRSAEEYRDKHD